ncbi:hypothetical protein [Massilia arenae]|uniref:Uncharacterized protein n=1 Tax=Massilia arenae TaxID=2603288 RepID=A0A5C7G411_9BURK|nr:hypothetical protein [Massilia arenae]TXG00072.1 hypothetical protein FVD38_10335 [Massilia arenae]
MTFLRTILALSLTAALAACGGQYDIDTTVQTASTTMIEIRPASVSAAAATVATVATVASATMPAPDCAAEGCASLRIIDGNAEAWRIDAQRRAALEASLPQT